MFTKRKLGTWESQLKVKLALRISVYKENTHVRENKVSLFEISSFQRDFYPKKYLEKSEILIIYTRKLTFSLDENTEGK